MVVCEIYIILPSCPDRTYIPPSQASGSGVYLTHLGGGGGGGGGGDGGGNRVVDLVAPGGLP